MDYNYITNIESCHIAIPHLLSYSHIPALGVALFLGIFVLVKNHSLLGKILFSLTIAFSFWILGSLITWVDVDSVHIMFVWSLFAEVEMVFYMLCLYFVYVFIDGTDISFGKKVLFLSLLLPGLIFSASSVNLIHFQTDTCEAVEGYYYQVYLFGVELFVMLWTISLIINRYFRAVTEMRKKIALLGFGVLVLLFVFFIAGIVSQLFDERGYSWAYEIEFYGLFGMIFFIGILTYLIVKYNVMNVKLAQAQVLVWSLMILIGSQFFFIGNPVNRVLNGIALLLVAVFGYNLVRSVKNEMKQNERLIHYSKELSRANAELKKLDSAKSEFISIASHQLRTPLTAIKGYISLILEGAYGTNAERTDDALNKIFLANERLIQLVEDMLNLTRIESGRLDYHLESNVQVEEILLELKDMFILRAQDKGLELTIVEAEKLTPFITADKSKLREVISNLMDNAIKYTKQGFVRVSAEPIGNVVRITIADSGMGISEESMKTLFTKFSRGTDSTKVYTDGSGLGLYVGKNLIESQGGHIYIESDGVDKGSRFIIEMPIKRDGVVMDQQKPLFVEGDGIKQ